MDTSNGDAQPERKPSQFANEQSFRGGNNGSSTADETTGLAQQKPSGFRVSKAPQFTGTNIFGPKAPQIGGTQLPFTQQSQNKGITKLVVKPPVTDLAKPTKPTEQLVEGGV